MKQHVRYQSMVIAGKLRTEVRITIDERGVEYTSTFDGNKSTSIGFFPIISIILTRQGEMDENGNRTKAVRALNDNLGMTRYNMPIFLNELLTIEKGLKIPELYTYMGKRLELNEELAEKVRRVFPIGNMTIELVPIVIIKQDDSRAEGIKMKFNNEQSSVSLTLSELESLIFHFQTLDIDSIALLMYLNYITKPGKPRSFDASSLNTNVDIVPKTSEFKITDLPI